MLHLFSTCHHAIFKYDAVIVDKWQGCRLLNDEIVLMQYFTESAHWADSVSMSRCPLDIDKNAFL